MATYNDNNAASLAALKQLVPPSCLILEDSHKKIFETDWRGRYSNPCMAVVMVDTITQIQQIIQWCNKFNIAIVPQGGNTSTCGSAVPAPINKPQIIINFSQFNHILEVNPLNNSMSVECGCSLKQVQQTASKYNLYFPLSIGSEDTCQIGGNIATNAGGINVLKYGTMRDLVLGLEVVLANGEIVNQLYNLRKNNTNFDLKQLFIGSEGTLGIITRANLKLFPKVSNYCTGMLSVTTLAVVPDILSALQQKYSVSAFEIINQLTQDMYNQKFTQEPFMLHGPWVILFEIELCIEIDIEPIQQMLNQHTITQCILTQNPEIRQKMWVCRKNIAHAEKQYGLAIKHDLALPLNNIMQFIQTNQQNILRQYPNAQFIIFGHWGDGNLHYNIRLNQLTPDNFMDFENIINEIVYADIQLYGGSFSAEHGIGMLKKKWFKQYYDSQSYQLAQSIKQLVDKNNILNPSKIFEMM